MKLWLRLAALTAFLLLPIAMPASAQYMFLDSNGDGLHTAADQLNSNGTPTTVDVYLITNMNRDGSAAVCDADNGATPLTMNSYVINLQASNGKVLYSNFINDQTTMTVAFGEVNPDSIRYKNGFGQQAALQPGKYKLATITIKGLSGAPKVDVVAQITGSPDATSFGSQCAGNDFDNTYKLGSDWHDSDGLSAAPGGGNVPPTLTVAADTTAVEGTPFTITATATDPDASDILTISATTLAPFLTFATTPKTSPATATESGTPPSLSRGTYTIVWSVSDGSNSPVTATTTLTVIGGDQCPVLTPIGNKTVTAGDLLTFTATATDPDVGQTLTFSLDAGAPSGAAINSSTGVFTWTPTAGQAPGVYTITVRVADNGTPIPCSVTQTFTVTVNEGTTTNQCPVLAPIGSKTVTEGSPLNFTATATDADVGQILTFSLGAGAPAGATINSSTGAFTWTPTASGVFPIDVRVTDNGSPACTDSETVSVTVNAATTNQCPVLAPIGSKTVTAGNLLTFTATATDADVGQTLTFSLGAGAPAGGTITSSTGVFTWTPTSSGTFPIIVRVTDNATPACTDSETVSVTVNAATGNQCPVLTPIGNKTVNELSILAFTASATDADAGQTLTFSLDSGAPAGSTINGSTGVFSWTPTEAQGPGVYTITVRVTDNGTPTPCSVFESIIVVVNEVNECPVLTAIANKTVNAGQLLTFTATATDADLPANTLTFSLDAGAPTGAAINSSTGVFTWTPTAGQAPGVYTITARVADNGTPTPCSVTQTFTVTVNSANANQCPVLTPIGNHTVTAGNMLTFTATATDADAGQTLTFSLDSGAPSGAAINSSTGVFTWTPTAGQAPGVYTITVRVTDNGTPEPCSVTQTFTVTVNTSGGNCGGSAFAFVTGGNVTTRLWTGKPTTCVQIEPDNGSFLTTDVVLSSITMSYNGNQISAVSEEPSRDTDQDGVSEITACFSKQSLRTLFAGLGAGEHNVDVTISGDLSCGGTFTATLSLRVLSNGDVVGREHGHGHGNGNGNGNGKGNGDDNGNGKGNGNGNNNGFDNGNGKGDTGNIGNKKFSAHAAPNPLNPETVVYFETSREGAVKVTVFDLSGRLVQRLYAGTMQAGTNSLRWDGTGSDGHRVASGVYYFKVQSVDGTAVVRVTVLK